MNNRCLTLAAAFLALGTFKIAAQETPSPARLTNDHYFELERISAAQISPDGAHIVYTRQQANRIDDKWDSSLWIMNADGTRHRFLAKGENSRWAPDGKRILYLAEGEPRGSQIFVRWIDGEGSASQVTRATEKVADANWSPDGKSIAFTMFVPRKNAWTISTPTAPAGAKWTPAPRIVETLHYRQDQVGFLEDGFRHLFVVADDGGTPRQLTSGKWGVGAGYLRNPVAMDWAPDSKSIVVVGNRNADADIQRMRSQLLVVDVELGTIRDLVAKQGFWGHPAVSPDGRTVAFTGYPTTDKTYTVADLYVVPIGGGDARKISGDYDRDPLTLRWAADGSGIYFDADDHGSRNVQFVSVKGGVRPVTSGTHMLTLDSASKDMTAAGTVTDPEHPAEVVTFSLGGSSDPRKLTNVNAGLLAGKKLAKTQEIAYTSTNNTKVQAWIVTPTDFDPAKTVLSGSFARGSPK